MTNPYTQWDNDKKVARLKELNRQMIEVRNHIDMVRSAILGSEGSVATFSQLRDNINNTSVVPEDKPVIN